MQHRMIDSDLQEKINKRGQVKLSPEEQAKRARYFFIDEAGREQLYVPSSWIRGCILNASRKFKVGRSSAFTYVAGSIWIEPTTIPLNTDQYEIDIRSANNLNMRSTRILVARPKIKDWEIEFKINYDSDVIPLTLLKNILEEAGRSVGIGSYNPIHGGGFGTFEVLEFAPVEEAEVIA